MNNVIFLVGIVVFYLVRFIGLFTFKSTRNAHFLLISFFLFSIPFELFIREGKPDPNILGGTLLTVHSLSIPLLLIIGVLLFSHKWKRFGFTYKVSPWIRYFFIFIVISLLNPYNEFRNGTSIFLVFFVSHLLLFHMLFKTCSKEQIYQGIYDGFLLLTIIQLILAICFPLLGMVSVTNVFHTGSEELATRFGTRSGAIGLFVHPGNLALFSMLATAFFQASWLQSRRKTLSLFLILSNFIIVFLTYSRTAYLVLVLMVYGIYFLNKNASKNIFSLGNLMKFIIPIVSFLIWVIFFSPLNETFLKSDASDQYSNRMIHWLMAYKICSISPVIGVGINAHLAFLAKNPFIGANVTLEEFFVKNPIHNIHLLVLSELGVLGLVCWIVFLFKKVNSSKISIASSRISPVISLTSVGMIIVYIFYGITGWAPLSLSILPYFLFFIFFSFQYEQKEALN